MNEIEWLVAQLAIQLPEAQATIDAPDKPKGNHWLDVRKDEKLVTVEWWPGQGFGFFAEDIGYGEAPNEIIPEKEKVLEKIIAFFKN